MRFECTPIANAHSASENYKYLGFSNVFNLHFEILFNTKKKLETKTELLRLTIIVFFCNCIKLAFSPKIRVIIETKFAVDFESIRTK